MDFEKKLGRLEEIVDKMEEGDLSLENSLQLFEEGIKLSRECATQLDQAEQKVKVLISMNDNGEMKLADFNPSETNED